MLEKIEEKKKKRKMNKIVNFYESSFDYRLSSSLI